MSLERGWAPRPPQDEAEDGDGAPRAPPPWLPSHVQVTVVQARGLRAKGGPGDAFVALQLGRQKHRTSVATQRGGCPRWAEECALEVPPPPAPHAGPDPEALLLQVTVWQRALVGADRFLGRAAVPLAALLEGGRSHQDQWYKLHSKPGKKEKDRGEVQLSIQFTRHSLTASMFDLSVKEKPRSPFGRLKDKVTGRRKYDLESASAIVPSSSGALDEELGPAGRKAKGKGLFFRSKLRRSSLTQSNTSLGSDSTASSASSVAGGSGTGAPGGMPPSPSRHGSLSTDPSARDFLPSPKLTHKRAFSDEASQIGLLPDARRAQGLTPQSEPVSRSSLCINGSHIYCEEPAPRPAGLPPAQSSAHRPSQGSVPGPCVPEPDLPPWPGSSAGGFQKGPPRDPPRFIPSPPILAAQEEDKLSVKTIALNRQRGWAKAAEGPGAQSRPVQIAAPLVFSAEVRRVRPRGGGQEEEEEDEARRGGAGPLRRASGRDSGESGGAAHEGPAEAAAREEEGRAGGGLRPGSPGSEEPARVPSSPPGLPAPTESAADAPLPEDRGPCPFVRAGERPAGPAPRRPSRPEAPARAPPEWDDSFDAFASSRLRPDAPREPPAPPPAAALAEDPAPGDDPWGPGPTEAMAKPQGSGGVARTGEEPRPGSPRPPDYLPEGGQSPPGDAPLPAGAAPESTATRGRPTWVQHPGGEQACWGPSGEAAGAWAAEPGQSSERGAAATPAALGWAQEDRGGRCASPLVENAFPPEEPGLPAEASGRDELGGPREGPPLLGSGQGPGGEVGEPPSASQGYGDAAERLGLPPPAGGPHVGVGPSQALEGPPRHEGQGTEEEGHGASEAPEPSGTATHSPGAPPPKPPRRCTPLGSEEDAGEALGWLGGTSGREAQGPEDPGEEAPPPAAPTSPAPGALIGAGGGSPWPATEGLRLPTEGDAPAGANEPTSPELPPGDAGLSAGEGAPGAEQFGTCPSELSTGPPGPPSAREGWGRPWGTESSATLPAPGSSQAAQGGPEPQVGGPWPCAAPWEPRPGATGLFWAATEEPPPPSPDRSALPAVASRGPGAEGPGSPPGQPSPAHPWALAGGRLRPGGETELSSGRSDDRVEDYKRADFWQAGGGMWGARQEAAPAPGNPFAPHPSPPLQSNPFVERAPGVSPVQPTARQQEEQGCSDHRAERALRGLFPELPTAAPSPHGSRPLASSTPFPQAAARPTPLAFTPPAAPPAPGGAPVGSSPAVAPPSLALPQPGTEAPAPPVLPAESQPAEEVPPEPRASPHPVKPLSGSGSSAPGPAVSSQEKPQRMTPDRSSGTQETHTPSATSSRDSASPAWQPGRPEAKKEPSAPDPSAKYLHLTHDELIQLLARREAELRGKQEHIRELENYIDRLLVRIMEQSPTLLQIPLGGEAKAAK